MLGTPGLAAEPAQPPQQMLVEAFSRQPSPRWLRPQTRRARNLAELSVKRSTPFMLSWFSTTINLM